MIFPNKKQVIFILCLLFVSHAIANEFVYLQIPRREIRKRLDSNRLSAHFAQASDPSVIVIPGIRWKLSGTGPSFLIEEFQILVKGGAEVKPLSDELHTMIDLNANALFSPNTPMLGAKQGVHHSTIQWTDIYFLVGGDKFVTFGLVEGGYVVCTKDEAGFIEKRKK